LTIQKIATGHILFAEVLRSRNSGNFLLELEPKFVAWLRVCKFYETLKILEIFPAKYMRKMVGTLKSEPHKNGPAPQ
jgi:hypothetical protein